MKRKRIISGWLPSLTFTLGMNRTLAPVRSIGPCLLIAAFAQIAVCRIPPDAYTNRGFGLLVVGWAIGSLLMDWFESRLLFAYLGSVALAAPVISYSMLGYGGLQIGGWFHAFVAPLWSLPFYFIFRRVRARRKEGDPSIQGDTPVPT